MASPLSLCLLALTTAVCMISTANANALPFSTNGGRNLYLGPDEFVVRGINYSCVQAARLRLRSIFDSSFDRRGRARLAHPDLAMRIFL